MRDPRQSLLALALGAPKTRSSAGIASALLVSATLLAGCGDPSAGGGTELPIQVRITVDSRMEATQWRLWTIEEAPLAARGAVGSYSFVSKGILKDSAGVLALPGDPGVFLLEAWVDRTPSESIQVAIPSPIGFAIDSSCIQPVPLSGEVVHVEVCSGMDKKLLPSGADTTHRPDQVSLIRIEGRTPQRIQILDDAGIERLTPAEARLWSISTDTGDDQILRFRGRLSRESDGSFRIPVMQGNTRYVIESSRNAGGMPTRIATHVRVTTGWTRYLVCMENILPPLPGTISVHDCPELGWSLSGSDSLHRGADLWSAFSLDIP